MRGREGRGGRGGWGVGSSWGLLFISQIIKDDYRLPFYEIIILCARLRAKISDNQEPIPKSRRGLFCFFLRNSVWFKYSLIFEKITRQTVKSRYFKARSRISNPKVTKYSESKKQLFGGPIEAVILTARSAYSDTRNNYFHKQWNYSDIQEQLFWLQGIIIPQTRKLSWQRQRGLILLHYSQEPLFWPTWTIIQTAREQYVFFWLPGAIILTPRSS
jgi:hypothetical protein